MANIELGTLKAVDRYIGILETKGVKPDNCTLDETKDPTSLPHILWMCNELKTKVVPYTGNGFSVDKYSRWLGFIQGILISKGLTTVRAERDVTRSWFNTQVSETD